MSKKSNWPVVFMGLAATLVLAGCASTPVVPATAKSKSVNTEDRNGTYESLVEVVANPGEIVDHLNAINAALSQAQASAADAQKATSISALKHYTNEVFQTVWGHSSELTTGTGAIASLGWREQWQTTYAIFDPAFAERYGVEPGAITDAAQLGIVGRGRFVRRALAPQAADNNTINGLLASLNNIIGWQRLDDGVTKAERQPRIDLTYMWDAEQEFWLSSADTGWIFEVAAQAMNILKTDYQDDLNLGLSHAADLAALIDRCIEGIDQNADGVVTAAPMEGGMKTVLQSVREAGL